ncbi:Disrupted in renal carcinoma protein 2 [Chionoecetes opilio]|uniref:Disrupted in renal carcinoma protein 2 n=1 Tax=Chionoecetes opilio TaxID=41210 RepID=A0A8J4YM50_CHIOP|nr:Disrupted in renal carcinoma protein 2 [Chionoecetes opilio]
MVQTHTEARPATTPPHTHTQQDVGHEKEPLALESSRKSYGSGGSQGGEEGVSQGITTYPSRMWMLFSFSLLCWVHNIEWITWGPVSESMNAAFPGWGPSTVALITNWGTIIYILFFIPIIWAAQRYGLRASVLASAAVLTAGAGLRCITSTTPAFTILCHVCGMAVGLSSPIMLAAPTLIASDWFPVHERTTAMAIMVGAHELGGIASFLEPLIVRLPGPDVTTADIRHDVMRLTYIAAGLAAVSLVALVVYFPSKPPRPPSLSSSEERLRFIPGLKALVRNKTFMLLLVCYGVFVGPPVMWMTVMDYSLLPLGFHQNKAMWVGVMAVVMAGTLPVVVGRLNDTLHRYTKTMLITLMLLSAGCFFWFLLLSYGVLPVTDWQVYVSTVGGLTFSYSTMPLFIELSINLAYPVPELLVTSVLIAADNIVGAVFLFLFNIPDEQHLWVTYTLTLCCSLTAVPLAAVTFPSTRTDIDIG